MFGIKAQITRCIDDSGHPSFVECSFVDAHGHRQIFYDKDAVFTSEMLDKNSNYPLDGIIGCVIVERKTVAGREIFIVDTESPWGIETTGGETVFEVLENQIIEFKHLGK